MTAAPASPGGDCPRPPVDLEKRKLPIKELDLETVPLRRIHRTVHDPVYFNKPGVSGSRFRFDAPNDEFGVLYASQSFDACVAETIVRDQFEEGELPLQLEEAQLAARSVSTLKTSSGSLRLVDLTEPVTHLGCTAQVLSDPEYAAPNLWSKALHDHPEQVDGIYFRSRYANEPSVAIFDHVDVIKDGDPTELLKSDEMGKYLDRYDIGLV